MTEIDPITAWGNEVRELEPEIAAELNKTSAVKAVMVEPPKTVAARGQLAGRDHRGRRLGASHPAAPRDPEVALPSRVLAQPKRLARRRTGMSSEQDVVEALASGFASHAERALDRGLLRGYVTVEERRPTCAAGSASAISSRDSRVCRSARSRLRRLLGGHPREPALLTASETLLRFPRIAARARSRLLHLAFRARRSERPTRPTAYRSSPHHAAKPAIRGSARAR